MTLILRTGVYTAYELERAGVKREQFPSIYEPSKIINPAPLPSYTIVKQHFFNLYTEKYFYHFIVRKI
jgi:hypothetical protein